MFIRTERLFLRPAWAEDAPALTRAIAHAPVARMLARVPWPYEESDALAWIGAPRDPLLPGLLVTIPDEGGTVIGGCGLHAGAEGAPAEVGYWITPAAQGHGYAREALSGLLAIARMAGHRHLRGRHMADNPASGRVLVAAGFRPTEAVGTCASLARGGAAPAVEYETDLADGDPAQAGRSAWVRSDAYVAGINAAA
ncbi:GNAT family N-acetyltransferase [Croceibacterium ferulae]|uniref:GNAT family N-acetyltransferase n=1 Tax=Croceibacterium ferulae TaxID=1854641 RepID=UPI000EAFA5B2|nr:GNAT family N-acetyltransferase [Croceibacterium ferulae]